MYTKAQFTRLGSFEEATHGWFWEATEIFSGRSVDLTLGSKAAVASRVEASA